jgi:hypothetical protein
MSQATVLALVSLLSNNIADPAVTPGLYSDVVFDWGSQPILTNGTLISLTAKAEEFQLPPQVLNVLLIIWDERELGKLTLREVEALNPSWRNKIGTPNSFIEQAETAKTLALYPTPFMPSAPNLVVTGQPFGQDFPLYSVVLLNTETRQDVPVYLELPLALLIIEREFIRESDHKDADFAQIAGDFGRWLLDLIMAPAPIFA